MSRGIFNYSSSPTQHPSTHRENIRIHLIKILYQLCASCPSLIAFPQWKGSVDHIKCTQQELNFPSSISHWAENVCMLWWNKSFCARYDVWHMRKEILGEAYGWRERCEVGCREDGAREREREVEDSKGGNTRCFPNSSLEFIVWKTCGLNLFWGERRKRSHTLQLQQSLVVSLCVWALETTSNMFSQAPALLHVSKAQPNPGQNGDTEASPINQPISFL